MATAATSLRPAIELRTALLLVDIQVGISTASGYFGTERSTPQFEENIANLLEATRAHNASHSERTEQIYIIHVFHKSIHPESPLWPNKPTSKIMACAGPVADEPVLSKNVNCSFVGTELESLLRGQEVRQLLICGLTTDHCVSTTVRLASDLNIVKRKDDDKGMVAIISDASAAFNNPRARFDAETVHAVNLASLEDEFADVIMTKDILGSVLNHA